MISPLAYAPSGLQAISFDADPDEARAIISFLEAKFGRIVTPKDHATILRALDAFSEKELISALEVTLQRHVTSPIYDPLAYAISVAKNMHQARARDNGNGSGMNGNGHRGNGHQGEKRDYDIYRDGMLRDGEILVIDFITNGKHDAHSWRDWLDEERTRALIEQEKREALEFAREIGQPDPDWERPVAEIYLEWLHRARHAFEYHGMKPPMELTRKIKKITQEVQNATGQMQLLP